MGEVIEIGDIIEGGFLRLCRGKREPVKRGDCEDVWGEIANREGCIWRGHVVTCVVD